LIHYYLALRAYDLFYQNHGRAPGSTDAVAGDTASMVSFVRDVLGEEPVDPDMVGNACSEMCVLLGIADLVCGRGEGNCIILRR